MAYTRDPRIDGYIDALPDWQRAICREVRDLVHAADGEVTETIKFINRPYFVLHGASEASRMSGNAGATRPTETSRDPADSAEP